MGSFDDQISVWRNIYEVGVEGILKFTGNFCSNQALLYPNVEDKDKRIMYEKAARIIKAATKKVADILQESKV